MRDLEHAKEIQESYAQPTPNPWLETLLAFLALASPLVMELFIKVTSWQATAVLFAVFVILWLRAVYKQKIRIKQLIQGLPQASKKLSWWESSIRINQNASANRIRYALTLSLLFPFFPAFLDYKFGTGSFLEAGLFGFLIFLPITILFAACLRRRVRYGPTWKEFEKIST